MRSSRPAGILSSSERLKYLTKYCIPTMPGHDIIVIGASAGGVEALTTIARGLSADLPAAVFAVMHFPVDAPSMLPRILARSGPLPAEHAVDGAPISHGRIYVAPSGFHLIVNPGVMRLSHGPTENRHRPAIDPLFRSAARAYGPRVVGVILTGNLDDGTAGLYAIRARGGLAVVQNPDDAFYPSMPSSALEYVGADYVVGLGDIAALVGRLAAEPALSGMADPEQDVLDPAVLAAEATMTDPHDLTSKGRPSVFTCPDCHGTLWEQTKGDLLRFRCRVGHAYSADSLSTAQGDGVEQALWAALRALEERAALAHRMAEKARERSSDKLAIVYDERHRESEHNADLLRNLLSVNATTRPSNPVTMTSHE
jgi:two-component system chemotaxis response regulator CheB